MSKTSNIIEAVVLCAVAFVVFAFLSAAEDSHSGWTSPVEIEGGGDVESLLFHKGKLWHVFTRGGYEREIAISYSEDGAEWSPPYTFMKDSPDNPAFFRNPQWLKRPDSTIWLLWYTGISDPEIHTQTISFATLEDDGSWSTPHEIHCYNGEDYTFRSIANTSEGGLIIMMHYKPPYYATIQGREVPVRVSIECVVQSADENLEWNPPISLSQTHFADAVDIYLDNEGIIWAVYEESDPLEGIYSRTSDDGITWSEPHQIISGSVYATTFFQRHNTEYVLFFIKDGSIYMITSSDGLKWSKSNLVFGMDRVFGLDATESDDGTIWALIDGKGVFYVTQYSDQQYLEDLQKIRDFRIKNGTLSFGIAVMIGLFWVFLKRRSFA